MQGNSRLAVWQSHCLSVAYNSFGVDMCDYHAQTKPRVATVQRGCLKHRHNKRTEKEADNTRTALIHCTPQHHSKWPVPKGIWCFTPRQPWRIIHLSASAAKQTNSSDSLSMAHPQFRPSPSVVGESLKNNYLSSISLCRRVEPKTEGHSLGRPGPLWPSLSRLKTIFGWTRSSGGLARGKMTWSWTEFNGSLGKAEINWMVSPWWRLTMYPVFIACRGGVIATVGDSGLCQCCVHSCIVFHVCRQLVRAQLVPLFRHSGIRLAG